MKKWIFVFLIISIGYVQAQNTDKSTTNLTEQEILNKLFEKTLEVLRVKIYDNNASSSTTKIDSVKLNSSAVSNTDTVLLSGTVWNRIKIRGVSASDSLAVGYGITAPTTFARVIGTTLFETGKLAKVGFTKLFIRAYGAANAIKYYQLVIEGY